MAKKISELPSMSEIGPADLTPMVDKTDNITKRASLALLVGAMLPIGCLYFTTDSANPSSTIGGEWEQFAMGKTIVGVDSGDTDFDTPELEGGERTHVLTEAEMPSHSHRQVVTANASGTASRNDFNTDGTGEIDSSTYDQGVNTYNAGSGNAHNNMQPYIVTYIWKRVA